MNNKERIKEKLLLSEETNKLKNKNIKIIIIYNDY